jgi:hypothetical protein
VAAVLISVTNYYRIISGYCQYIFGKYAKIEKINNTNKMNKSRKPCLTLSLSQEDIDNLSVQAARLGHYWGSTPSPSSLISAIANGKHIEGSLDALKEMEELRKQLALANQRLDLISKIAVSSIID